MKNSSGQPIQTLTDDLRDWIDRFFQSMSSHGVDSTDGARRLLALAVEMQLVEGPVDRPERVLGALQTIDMDQVSALYLLKYGGRRLTFNRMTRLLGDLHEAWLDVKEAQYGRSGGRTIA